MGLGNVYAQAVQGISPDIVPSWLVTIRPYLEILHFLSGILLVVGIGFAFRQLQLMKRDIDLRNDRCAKEKSIEANERYASKYVPLARLLYDQNIASGITSYSGPIGDFTPASIPSDRKNVSLVRLNMDACLPALNELEVISSMFVTGVADEALGFTLFGRTFCKSVEAHYDIISTCHTHKTCPYFGMIVQLYGLWAPRLEKMELGGEIESLISKHGVIQDRSIPPLGRQK